MPKRAVAKPKSPASRKAKGTSAKRLVCPLMSEEEAGAVSVPLERVETDLPRVMAEFGVAIVTGCVSPEGCAELEAEFSRDLGSVIDVSSARKTSRALGSLAEEAASDVGKFPLSSVERLGEKHRCQLRGLPHGRFAWSARLHPNVRRCYRALHPEAERLISSCDNSFFSPADASEERDNRNWPHVDQNCSDTEMGDIDVYQGLLYVWPSMESRASTTVVLIGSHREHYGKIMSDPSMISAGRRGSHFSMIKNMCPGESKNEVAAAWRDGARRCRVPAGGLLLWSSKTLHQGWMGGPRLAQPVCWEPEERRSLGTLKRKLRLAALGLPSTHSASQGLPHYLVPCKQPEGVGAGEDSDKLPVLGMCALASLASGVSTGKVWEAGLGDGNLNDSIDHEKAALLDEFVAAEVAAAL
uniref:Uncharacterized protein n=1 Tax=Trieres chinensis TaxID=1514140 RepID=A0A7S1ZFD9_TRICV|mmetsp:Transcript_24161/g.48945  ORF Transcript_24161/g.48945 Transcript_24161/m.48945 type:complete len:413 (+) Transcript_24161:42-1280(+)|eukprot:CAMPEP_0183295872 /NCGR_PEP_ID=MMETSP0160_2-20130417/3662_1 /TAXON_ID=2839 ORGANISM="Odontella Sinensis, Strain Grunow 1884" /NCGR_SAMPLE_ID=MMETSP0160_2 /ASSEMBLY_ACC=CAM_ASM_000250 /LENGTH=412 /DNA_ID=CAMNT_0025457411 /DNA_START=36 /DNA_END=1274 /DNA_ORIENTATION=-